MIFIVYIYIYTLFGLYACIYIYMWLYIFFVYTYHSFSLSVIINTGIFMIGICSPRSLWKAEKNSGLRRALNHLHLLHLVASMDFQIFLTTFVIVSDPLISKWTFDFTKWPFVENELNKWPFAPVKLTKGHLESPGSCCYRCWLRSNMAPSGN